MSPRQSARSRVERIDLVARMLRDRPGITATDLAAELDVSVRSVFRDIELLRERGYPIDAARGRGGGLRLHASWGLGRVLLSSEEAFCTLLSLAVIERLGFPMFAGDVARARRKIVDAFPAAERRRIGPLRERVFVGPNASASVRGSYGAPVAGPMRGLQVAFVAERTIVAEYAKEGGERSVRRIEPHALLINWPAWYLLAFDHLRGELRTFRLDRFVRVEVEGTSFRPRPLEVARALLAGTGVPLRGV